MDQSAGTRRRAGVAALAVFGQGVRMDRKFYRQVAYRTTSCDIVTPEAEAASGATPAEPNHKGEFVNSSKASPKTIMGIVVTILTMQSLGCGSASQPVLNGQLTGNSRILGINQTSERFLSQETLGLREWSIQPLGSRSTTFSCSRSGLRIGAIAESSTSWLVLEQTKVVRFNTAKQSCDDLVRFPEDNFGLIRSWYVDDRKEFLSVGSETGNVATIDLRESESLTIRDWGFPKTDSPILLLRHGVPTNDCRAIVTQAGQLITQTSGEKPRLIEFGSAVAAADVWADGKTFSVIVSTGKKEATDEQPNTQLLVGDTLTGSVRLSVEVNGTPYGLLCSDIVLPGTLIMFFHNPPRIEIFDPRTQAFSSVAEVDNSVWTWREIPGSRKLLLGTSARVVIIDVGKL